MSEIPEGFNPLDSSNRVQENRRRRRRKLLIPSGKNERTLYIGEIARRLVPDVEFFGLTILAGIIFTLAILLNSPAFFVLGALIVPFMVPAVGLGFSAAIGSLGFFLRSLGSLLLACLFVFLSGLLGGWISRLFIDLPLTHSVHFTTFSVTDFILLTIGVFLAIYLTIKNPRQRPLLASVPLAYEIYAPVAVAGFGLTSGAGSFFPDGLKVAGVNIAWVILVGTFILAVLKLRPFTFFGYLLTAAVLGAAVYTLVITSALGSALQKQVEPFRTIEPTPIITMTQKPTKTPRIIVNSPTPLILTETPTPTNTLIPTNTPTLTVTPKPTPVWAVVFSAQDVGVIIRKSPGFSSQQLISLLNGQPVQVLPEVEVADGVYWMHVLLEDGRDGWIARNLLVTATPIP